MTVERGSLAPPGPETMVAVLIGASDYPHKPDWSNSVLGTSAKALRNYVLSPSGLALSSPQLLDLFDNAANPTYPTYQLQRVTEFLSGACAAHDLLLYYIGHGAFHNGDYLLGIRFTKRGQEYYTTIESKKLAQAIRGAFSRKRVYVILDSCFSQAPSVTGRVARSRQLSAR